VPKLLGTSEPEAVIEYRIFLPLNFKRLNAKAEAAPITTELIATTDEMINEFFTHDKNGILGEEKSIL